MDLWVVHVHCSNHGWGGVILILRGASSGVHINEGIIYSDVVACYGCVNGMYCFVVAIYL